jgi:hypothetical protein
MWKESENTKLKGSTQTLEVNYKQSHLEAGVQIIASERRFQYQKTSKAMEALSQQ